MVFAQGGLIEIPPISAEGLPVENIEVYVTENDSTRRVTGEEYGDFLSYFNLENKGLFNKSVYDLIRKEITGMATVARATYGVYNAQVSGQVTVRWFIALGKKEEEPISGFFRTGQWGELPLLLETGRSKVTLFLNGGLGAFLERDAFFGAGDAFTQGNPVADDPATGGATPWLEVFLEPGIGGITALGKSDLYLYGALSGLFSARIGTDIYSEGSTIFGAFERAYAGFIWARIGKENKGKLDVSAGRNFFQLNDGFLFSRYSGSANAGDRGSAYLSSRTAFQKTVLATYTQGNWTVSGFFVEPQELFKDRQANINYTGLTVGFNDNETIDANLSAIQRTGGSGLYRLPGDQNIEKKGLWVINPKLWLVDILQTGLFLKSEFALEWKSGMRAHAWYLGGGIKKEEWLFKPSLYYRYAFMQGDDPETNTYERFDPLLTGGLGTWVQGLNFRKVIGTGNIISHRIELTGYVGDKLRLSFDAFFLKAHQLNNLGGLAPIAALQSKNFGQEYSLTGQYSFNPNYLLLAVVSGAFPGGAIRDNLPGSRPWQTFQLSLFAFY